MDIVNWNLGSRQWSNKRDDILHLVTEINPDLVAISEANLYSTEDDHSTNIPGYELITTVDYGLTGISRLVVLAKTDLNYTVMIEKMEPKIASIWLRFPRKGKKPLIVGALYREHHLLEQDLPNRTGEPATQNERWNKILNQWTNLPAGAEVLVVGDLNIDFTRWTNPDHLHKYMTDQTRLRIEGIGYVQLVKEPTRYWQQTKPSLIDQSWTNSPNMIVKCLNISRPVADHNMIVTTVNLKSKPRTNCEIIKRDFKNFNTEGFQHRVRDIDWEEIYKYENVNLAYDFLESKLLEALAEFAPMKKIQPSRRKKLWVTERSRQLISIRDRLKEIANTTDNELDWMNFRKYRNLVTGNIKKDKKLHLENLYNKADKKNGHQRTV